MTAIAIRATRRADRRADRRRGAPAPTPAGRPAYVIYVVQRHADGSATIVEAWEATPPFGWVVGTRKANGSVSYRNRSTDYAADHVLALVAPGTPITVEAYYAGRERPVRRTVPASRRLPFDAPLLVTEDED